MKTFIKWQGNKSKHINKFIEYFPEITGTYIEPFVGSGAVLLKLQPKKWIINDLNKDLINIWNQVKNKPHEIIQLFKTFGTKFKPLSKKNKVIYCKELIPNIESLPYNLQRATYYLLMKCCSYTGDILVNNNLLLMD
jgi:site-specific DNA-adenine methylase